MDKQIEFFQDLFEQISWFFQTVIEMIKKIQDGIKIERGWDDPQYN